MSHYNALLSGERVLTSFLELEKADILQKFLQDLTGAIKTRPHPVDKFNRRPTRFQMLRRCLYCSSVG